MTQQELLPNDELLDQRVPDRIPDKVFEDQMKPTWFFTTLEDQEKLAKVADAFLRVDSVIKSFDQFIDHPGDHLVGFDADDLLTAREVFLAFLGWMKEGKEDVQLRV